MNEGTKILDILQVIIPGDTPLTVSSEVKILEILGMVKDPQLIRAMQLVSALVPPATPATLKGPGANARRLDAYEQQSGGFTPPIRLRHPLYLSDTDGIIQQDSRDTSRKERYESQVALPLLQTPTQL